MNSSQLKWFLLVVFFLAFLLFVRYCFWPNPPVAELPYCPDHKGFPPITGGGPHMDTLPLSGVITGVPEFHDCQRLRDANDSTIYGPLAGIWVAQDLGLRFDSLAASPPQEGAEGGLSIALVYSWEQPYDPLHMQAGWNCLFFVRAATVSKFAAYMVPVDNAGLCTQSKIISRMAATLPRLNVFSTSFPSPLRREDVPPVGRWDWDGHQYIGVGCGDQWCDVTPGSTAPPPPPYSLPTGTAEEQRVYQVKGWYDEERLAVSPQAGAATGVTGLNLVPAGPVGTVVPDPALDAITDQKDFDGHWVHVATVGLEANNATYITKLNLHQGTMPKPGVMAATLTDVFMCKIGEGKCEGATGLSCQDVWRAKIASGETSVYRCVKRTDHSGLGVHIPGTVRWQWENDDQKLWAECAEGCCKVQ
jgi:hypothetical protein